MYSRIVLICTLVVAATAFRSCHRKAIGNLPTDIGSSHIIVHEIKKGPVTFLDLSYRCPMLGSKHSGSEMIVCSDSSLVDIQLESINHSYVYSSTDSVNLILGIAYCSPLNKA